MDEGLEIDNEILNDGGLESFALEDDDTAPQLPGPDDPNTVAATLPSSSEDSVENEDEPKSDKRKWAIVLLAFLALVATIAGLGAGIGARNTGNVSSSIEIEDEQSDSSSTTTAHSNDMVELDWSLLLRTTTAPPFVKAEVDVSPASSYSNDGDTAVTIFDFGDGHNSNDGGRRQRQRNLRGIGVVEKTELAVPAKREIRRRRAIAI